MKRERDFDVDDLTLTAKQLKPTAVVAFSESEIGVRQEYGEWGSWGEWGSEGIVEKPVVVANTLEDLRRLWDRSWSKSGLDNWKRGRTERSSKRKTSEEGDLFLPSGLERESWQVTISFGVALPQPAGLKALSARMAEYGVVEHIEFTKPSVGVVYFLEHSDGERARRDMDGEPLEVSLDHKSTKAYEMNIDRVQSVKRVKSCVCWAGPFFLDKNYSCCLPPAFLASLFRHFGECVCVLRRGGTNPNIGSLHARYRFQSDAVTAVTALQQKLREDWEVLSGLSTFPVNQIPVFSRSTEGSSPLPSLSEDEIIPNTWYRGVVRGIGGVISPNLPGIKRPTGIILTVSIGLERDIVLINDSGESSVYVSDETIKVGDQLYLKSSGASVVDPGKKKSFTFTRTEDFGWPPSWKRLYSLIERQRFRFVMQALVAYGLVRHPLAFLIMDVLIALKRWDFAKEFLQPLDLKNYFQINDQSKDQCNISDTERPCETLPLPSCLFPHESAPTPALPSALPPPSPPASAYSENVEDFAEASLFPSAESILKSAAPSTFSTSTAATGTAGFPPPWAQPQSAPLKPEVLALIDKEKEDRRRREKL